MRRPIIVLVMVLALVGAACGGGGGGDAGGGGTPATSAPAGGGGGDAAHGQELFKQTCAACHGTKAEGIEGLGKPLTKSEFVQGLSDDELVAFIEQGRPASDPENTTGVDMPPKGGNPSLSDADLYDIVAWLRTLQ
ncbi:MAG TPA: cytochrome c [Actinobacteria bacterium]|nr:cytochrome c [Actinomycetota bacterium]